MNVLVPLAAMPELSVPPVGIADGCADPVWVELPSRGGFLYGRRRTIRLPFDPVTAAVARRWLRHERRRRVVVTPILVTLLLAAFAALRLDADPWLAPVLLILNATGGLWAAHAEKRVTVAQHPEMIGRLGVYLPAMPAAVAEEWARRNPAVQLVTERPRWRRFPSAMNRP